MTVKSPQELSADTQFILQRLRDAKEGEFIPYSELNALIGRDVQRAAKNNLRKAFDIAVRDYEFVFVCITNLGVKRLTNEEIAPVSNASNVKKIKGHVYRWQNQLSCVDYDRLGKCSQRDYNLGVTLAGTLSEMSSHKAIDKLKEAVVNSKTGTLPLTSTLDVFKSV